MRKVIQIKAVKNHVHDTVYALCDDGSIWYEQWNGHQLVWMKKPPIPQDNGDNHESSH